MIIMSNKDDNIQYCYRDIYEDNLSTNKSNRNLKKSFKYIIPILLTIVFIIFVSSKCSCENSNSDQYTATYGTLDEETVYITLTGKKYHKSYCHMLNDSKISISLSNAISQGYDACQICY
jgi:hypothetical protein